MVLNVSQREFNTNSVVFVSFFLVDLSFLTSFNHWEKKFNLIFVCLSYDAFRIILFLQSAEGQSWFYFEIYDFEFYFTTISEKVDQCST